MSTDTEHYARLAIELQRHHRKHSNPIAGWERLPWYSRVRLDSYDFWQMQEHRRHCEAAQCKPRPQLASFLRKKLARAEIRAADGSFATGSSAVLCRIDGCAAQWVQLYHWDHPNCPNATSVGAWLGAILIGMSVGQIIRFPRLSESFLQIEVLSLERAS